MKNKWKTKRSLIRKQVYVKVYLRSFRFNNVHMIGIVTRETKGVVEEHSFFIQGPPVCNPPFCIYPFL